MSAWSRARVLCRACAFTFLGTLKRVLERACLSFRFPEFPINVLTSVLPFLLRFVHPCRFNCLRRTTDGNKSQVEPAGFDLHLPEWLNTPPAKARFAALRVCKSTAAACDPPSKSYCGLSGSFSQSLRKSLCSLPSPVLSSPLLSRSRTGRQTPRTNTPPLCSSCESLNNL